MNKKYLFSLSSCFILVFSMSSCKLTNNSHDWYWEALGLSDNYGSSLDLNKAVVGIVDSGIDASYLNFFDAGAILREDDLFSDNCSNEHGSQIASLISGNTNGIGVCKDIKLISENVFDDNSLTTGGKISIGILNCLKNGASVINLSLGSKKYDEECANEIDNAVLEGTFIVSAVGDGKSECLFPANRDNVISVVACDNLGTPYSDTNSYEGINNTVFFPGVDIKIPFVSANGEYSFLHRSASSFATAIASAVISLIASTGSYSINQIVAFLNGDEFKENHFFSLSRFLDDL